MSRELEELFDKLEEKHYSEASRQDHTTWAIFDLLDVIKNMTNKENIHKELDKIRENMLKNA